MRPGTASWTNTRIMQLILRQHVIRSGIMPQAGIFHARAFFQLGDSSKASYLLIR